ncbi:hypothetical protein A3H26_04175 [candidate division WWE3 bacterium RIFCSPLOWO2_12_FULL_36_10]|uniref:Nucleotidyl transferase AbiEii toxin, Type IV TA system n=1 Tax=candidate division WWE3 bacterium RIFCSPLOWO2_12_FULL_36_10 TaxID=1802630 RepID=A0A1F4VJ72_UNCKA|nr:MAG: hypothetical protein A3H26_04175 [candidate division WWE3 bacterium RIFCSPLOWO2_12_FULL_36_10]
MHKEVLSKTQINLLPLIKTFSSEFGLVGGTAIALHLGHRRSIDFDLFIEKSFSNESLLNRIKNNHTIQIIMVDKTDELTLVIDNVKVTFYKYPYKIKYLDKLDDIIKFPDLLTLGAMKAFALGRRAKWKDYIDIFFILNIYTFEDVVLKTRDLFGSEFNERLFREQLSYYEDINYEEKIDYMEGKEVSDDRIKRELSKFSLK